MLVKIVGGVRCSVIDVGGVRCGVIDVGGVRCVVIDVGGVRCSVIDVGGVRSAVIDVLQVSCAHSQLTQYETRYRSRLKANNLMYIRHLLYILTGFMKALGGNPSPHLTSHPHSSLAS